MITVAQTDRWLICGRPRSGKTNLMKHLIFSKYGGSEGKFLMYDPDHELSNLGLTIKDVEEVAEVFPDISDYVVYQPSMTFDFEERREDFNELCHHLNSINCDFAFCIDEISNITVTPRGVPVETSSQFKVSVSRRGKRGMEIFVTSQKPKNSTTTFISQSTKVAIFDIFPHDIDYLEEKIGITLPTEHVDLEFGEKTQLDLNKYEFFLYDDVTREFSKYKLMYPSEAERDISRNPELANPTVIEQIEQKKDYRRMSNGSNLTY